MTTNTTAAKAARRDVATEITETIVAELEKGVAPWVRPWDEAPLTPPTNATTGKTYRGVNVLLLWMSAARGDFADHRWLTFRQAKELGGTVRRGEKGTRIVFWRFVEREERNADGVLEKRTVGYCRNYTVFNVAQCDGLALEAQDRAPAELGAAERLAESVGASVSWGRARAWFSPQRDEIGMPARERFESPEACEATLLHELTHWTGHESRLARTFGKRFGDDAYAFEELVAELGAAMLCAELGVSGRLQHAEYLATWAKVLRADRHAIFTASRLAQNASAFLLSRESAGESEDDDTESDAA